MGELRKVGQYHCGIGPGVVLSPQLRQCRCHIPAHDLLEEVDHPRPICKPEHLPHMLDTHGTGGMRDSLIEQ
jgi:hypothetical protein